MKKKEYQTPTLRVVLLQHHSQMLSGSPLGNVDSNLTGSDVIEIDTDTLAGEGFWGR